MKRTDEDIQFAELLKAHMPETSENPWFTRKVMNRLPYKPKTMPRWIKAVGYGICIMLMAFSCALLGDGLHHAHGDQLGDLRFAKQYGSNHQR